MRIQLQSSVRRTGPFGRSVIASAIAGVLGCGAFGAETEPLVQPPPTADDAGGEDAGADVSGGEDVDGAMDSATDSATECSGAVVLRDDFEGSVWNGAGWDSKLASGQGTYTIDPRHQVGTTSLRFATKFFSDAAFLTKSLSGRCPITVRTWLYVGATSTCDGTSLIRIKLANGNAVAVHLIEGAWISASGVSPGLGALTRQTWTEIVLKYDPKTGTASLTAGSLARGFTVDASEPVSIDLGILGAADGGINGDEILYDDVSITR